jgi:PhzF family phenazine biosynthesis protein
MPLDIIVVDAFTDRPFGGNPAAVCILPQAMPDAWMQSVAAEMKHAETAFVSPGNGRWDLRWFTPTTEVELCGHATLAAAHTLWESGRVAATTAIDFVTQSGVLTCRASSAPDGERRILMDFPADPPAQQPLPTTLAESIGAAVRWSGKGRFDWLLELSDAATVRELEPDLNSIAALSARGVIVTARSADPGFDFVSRFFAPGVGVPEDPVTGSAHCCLAPFWSERLGRDQLVGRQVSGRGGEVGVRLLADRVELSGTAVTILHGRLSTAVERLAEECDRGRS